MKALRPSKTVRPAHFTATCSSLRGKRKHSAWPWVSQINRGANKSHEGEQVQLTPGSGHSEPLATQAKKLCLLRFSLGPNIQRARKRGFSYEVNLSWKSVGSRDSGAPWGILEEESLLCWSIDGDRGFGGRLSRCDSWRWDFYFPFFSRFLREREGGDAERVVVVVEGGVVGLLLLYCCEPFNENNRLTLLVTIAPAIGFIRFPNCSDLKQLLKWPLELPYLHL